MSRTDVARRSLSLAGIKVEDDHPAALRGEGVCGSPADAAG